GRAGDRRPEIGTDAVGLGVARTDLELLLAIFRAGGDGERLRQADLIFAREIEVEDILAVAEPAGVEVALALRPERGRRGIVEVVVEAVVAAARRQIGLPAGQLAMDSDRGGIIL